MCISDFMGHQCPDPCVVQDSTVFCISEQGHIKSNSGIYELEWYS